MKIWVFRSVLSHDKVHSQIDRYFCLTNDNDSNDKCRLALIHIGTQIISILIWEDRDFFVDCRVLFCLFLFLFRCYRLYTVFVT